MAQITSRLCGANSAFVTVKLGDRTNTMTLGWGMEGVLWGKKIFAAAILKERFSYDLLMKANCFAVSFPKTGEMKEALAYFGSKSGWDGDKHAPGPVELLPCGFIDGYHVGGCEEHYECRLIYAAGLDRENFIPGAMPPTLHAGRGDELHVLCFGEILNANA